MKIALLFPPLGSITHPYSSLPYLTGFLRSRGHEVFQFDLGIRAINAMFSPAYLQQCHKRILRRLDRLSGPRRLSPRERRERNLLLAADLFAPDVSVAIEEAKSILRHPERFYQPQEYRRAVELIRRAFELVSAAHFPTRLTYNSLAFGCRLTLPTIHRLAQDEEHNPFCFLLRNVVLPEVLSEIPPLVGISITYNQQMVPGWTLARLIKARAPGTHIVMGGAALNLSEPRLRRAPAPFRWVDSYVFGEGETPLLQLIEMIIAGRKKRPLSQRFYLKSDRRDLAHKKISMASRCEREDFESLPPPDYRGLNLDDYLSPEPVFLLTNARGCYWNRCTFCNVSLAFKTGFQKRSAEKLRRDLVSLRDRHNGRFIFFCDDGLTPRRCREISRFSASFQPPFFWQSMIRYEKGLTAPLLKTMAAAGCRQLSFGHESSCQRVLDLMGKGVRLEENLRIIQDAFRAGIGVHLNNFLGFPGETSEEAEETINFLLRHRSSITGIALRVYMLTEFSAVHLHPADFGIFRLRPFRREELVPDYHYSVQRGVNRREAEEIFYKSLPRLRAAYPCLDYFLDSPFGAHSFLYLAYFGGNKIENIFPQRQPGKELETKKLHLVSSVKRRQLSRHLILLYHPASGQKLKVYHPASACLSSLARGATLSQLQREALPRSSPRQQLHQAAAIMIAAAELYQRGFIEFE